MLYIILRRTLKCYLPTTYSDYRYIHGKTQTCCLSRYSYPLDEFGHEERLGPHNDMSISNSIIAISMLTNSEELK